MSKSNAKKAGRSKKKGKVDDQIDYEQSTWSTSPPKTMGNSKKRSFEYPSPKGSENHRLRNNSNKKMSASVPNIADVSTQHKSQEMMYEQLNNRSKRQIARKKKLKIKTKTKTHIKSKSALPNKKKEKKKLALRARTSDPEKVQKTAADSPDAKNVNKKNLVIKINDEHKKKEAFDVNAQRQTLGDILIHVSAWNALIVKKDANGQKVQEKPGWKKIYAVLDHQTLRFWDGKEENSQSDGCDGKEMEQSSTFCIYLSEILTLNKSIRAIDGEKYIIEMKICGIKCLLSFANIEQREYWHSLLSDYHLNYFVWRSNATPLDEQKRRSQNVLNGVYKLLKWQKSHKRSGKRMDVAVDTLNILYIEEILQKISALNMTKIVDLVPVSCQFMSGRLVRVIMSIKFFFMSVLKSLSGADIALPSRQILMTYLDEIGAVQWSDANLKVEVLDFYCDECYRILFNLSFAFTSNARDEIMKLNEYIHREHSNKDLNVKELEQKFCGMKFEYESLQRSWKMHRDRLQEYVMAYRDAVAKLKHSYHQRDGLCAKIETLQKEKKQLNESIEAQNETYKETVRDAQKLTLKFSTLSQQMQEMQLPEYAPMPMPMPYPQYSQMQYMAPYQLPLQPQEPPQLPPPQENDIDHDANQQYHWI